MVRKFVLAIDGSKQAEGSYLWYVNELHRDGDEVHLVTAHESSSVPLPVGFFGADPTIISDEWIESVEESYKETKWMIESYKARLDKLGIKADVHIEQTQGCPGAEVCGVAEKIAADCIVMGSRGQGVLRRTFLGSVSDYVLHHASCPVLVVKDKGESKD